MSPRNKNSEISWLTDGLDQWILQSPKVLRLGSQNFSIQWNPNFTQNCLNCKFIEGCPVIEDKASPQYEFEIDSLVLRVRDPLPRLRPKSLYFFRRNGRLVLSVYVIKAKANFAIHERKSSRNTAR